MMLAVNRARAVGDGDPSMNTILIILAALVSGGVPLQASRSNQERGLGRVAGERTPAALVSLLLAFLLPACAARQPSSPFIIRSGHGPIDAGHLPAPSKSQRQDMEHARRRGVGQTRCRAARDPALD